MKKKKIIYSVFLLLTVSFLVYCFYPVFIYKENIVTSPWNIILFDRKWVLITDKAKKWWYKIVLNKNINLKKIKVIRNIIEVEDKKYYDHFWVNILSKFRAFKDNILWKRISWWSTITEQFIKNKYFKESKRSYLQKLREATLAIYFSIIRDKNEILIEYLDNIYLWNQIYWIKSASLVYFWKSNLEELNNEEITLLISLINNPWIQSLGEKQFNLYFEKVKTKLGFNFKKKIFKLNKKENIDIFPFVTNNNITTIDSDLQQFWKDILNQTIKELEWKNVTNWAIFALNPKNWEILIYQWSKSFYSSDIDWQVDVIKALRQPWSTMKPFLYLLALESWANPDDLIIDIESEYNSFVKWKTYISENYSLKEYGLVRFKKALWNSFNNATVRLAKELWIQEVYNFYKSYWFQLNNNAEYYWYSLVLWNPSISLENLVNSYVRLLPDTKEKFLLYDILKDPDNRDISFWVNSILSTSIPQAVKTWTSSDFRDNLIVSYHPNFVIWIWVWNNDNSSMIWVTGITWAGYIWYQIIEKAIELWYITDYNYDIPEWIIESNYCLDINCFRKQLILKKENKEYFSKLKNNIYDKRDIFEKLSDFELDKLQDMWIEIK